jgi:hypothetical protein
MASYGDLSSGDAAIRISPTEPSHGLLGLPNEVLSMVVSECEPTDMKHLRLVSKLMHQISTGPFARKYFSRRRFLLTHPSMKALVDITANPTFGPYLTCITFGTYRLTRNLELEDPFTMDDARHYNHHSSIETKHRAFVERNEHVKMLTRALENLKKCQNTSVALGIYDDIHDGEFRRRGYALKASYQGCCDFEPYASTALDAVLTACLDSEFPLKALKLFLSKDSDSLDGLTLPNRVLELFVPHGSYKPTTDLHVNVWQEQGAYAKMKVLSGFTCLELSRHHVGNPDFGASSLMTFDDFQYGKLWETIMSSSLQSISLEVSDTEYPELVQMLSEHKDELRTLKLRQVRLIVFEPPKDLVLAFLRFLRNNLTLTHLCMDDFLVEDVNDVEPSLVLPAREEELVCNGREEVEEGLQTLIEEVEQEYHDD